MGRFEAFINDMAKLYKRINIDVTLNDNVDIIFTSYDGKMIQNIPHALCDCEYEVIRTSRDGPIDGAGTIYVRANVDVFELIKPKSEKQEPINNDAIDIHQIINDAMNRDDKEIYIHVANGFTSVSINPYEKEEE